MLVMQKSIIIIGAGVIGAAVAYQLTRQGAQVTVLDAGHAAATEASFGWVNASYFLNEEHFHLRVAGMAAYQQLAAEIDLPATWYGSICWEEGRPNERSDALKNLGYEVDVLDAAQFAELEPHVNDPPEQSLFLKTEGAVEPGPLTAALIKAAQENGASVMRGVQVHDFINLENRVVGVRTNAGAISGDQVLIAAGVGSRALSEKLGMHLPMLHRPALVIKTRPVPKILGHILVSDLGEVRQLPDGSLIMPAVVGHQSDAGTDVGDLATEAGAALARLQGLLPSVPLTLAEAMIANRPMPGDGLPAVGPICDGAYVATMHSGITLAALMGELISGELLNDESNHSRAWLSPYRPHRFTPNGILET